MNGREQLEPLPAYDGNELFIFVCYAHVDKDIVYPEIRWLQDQGVSVWYDEGISPGKEWTDELGIAIDRANQLLFFVSPSSVASENCRNEVHFAQSHKTQILTVHLEETELPMGLELMIGSSQAILKSGMTRDVYRQKLLQSVGTKNDIARPSITDNVKDRSRSGLFAQVLSVVVLGLLAWVLIFDSEPTSTSTASSVELSRSVTVKPFDNIGSDPGLKAFADGLSVEVKSVLSGFQELQTVADNQSAGYEVRANIQGAGEINIQVRLDRATDGQSVWTDTFVVSRSHGLTEQQSIAQTVARFVRWQLTRDHECEGIKHKTESLKAANFVCAGIAENYQANQKGYLDWESMRVAAESALAVDPELADAYWLMGQYQMYVANDIDQAIESFERGVSLEPKNPKMQMILGVAYLRDFNYELAETSLQKALQLDPLSPFARWAYGWLAEVALHHSDLDGASEHYARSIRIYDADARIYQEYARLLNVLGRHREALSFANDSISLVTAGTTYHHALREKLIAQVEMKEPEQAEQTFAIWRDATMPGVLRVSSIEFLARLGQINEARSQLKNFASIENEYFPLTRAYAYALMGDQDKTIDAIADAFESPYGYWILQYLRTDPLFGPARRHARWIEIEGRLQKREVAGQTRQAID